MIIIKHNDVYLTHYAHCDTILVKEGQTVESGDTIATCGQTGAATGHLLHFEIRKNGKPVNPHQFLFPDKYIAPVKSTAPAESFEFELDGEKHKGYKS